MPTPRPSSTHASAAMPSLAILFMPASFSMTSRSRGRRHLTRSRFRQLLRSDVGSTLFWRTIRTVGHDHPIARVGSPARPARGRRAKHPGARVGSAPPGRLRLPLRQRRQSRSAVAARGAVRRDRARPDAAARRRPHHLPDGSPAGRQSRLADPHADRAHYGIGQGARPRKRRRRLRHQAVRRTRAHGPNRGADSPRSQGAGTGGRPGPARGVRARRGARSLSATPSACVGGTCRSRRTSSSCCINWLRRRGSCCRARSSSPPSGAGRRS